MSKETPPSEQMLIGTDSVSARGAAAFRGGSRRQDDERDTILVDAVIQRNEKRDLQDWIACLLRRKKTILIVSAAIFLLSAVYTALQTPIYRSEAVLEIEKDSGGSLSNLGEAITQGIGVADPEVFATQIEIIKGRTLVEALIDTMHLGDSTEEPGVIARLLQVMKGCLSTIFPSLQVTSETVAQREGLVKRVTKQVNASRDAKSRLIKVSVDAKSPQAAQEMLRKHVDNFLSQNLAKRRRVQTEAAEWAIKEMASAEKKLVESLTNLVSFTTEHGVLSVDDSTNHVLTFFQKAADSLVRSTEQRVQVEALHREGDARAAAVSPMKSPDADQMFAKLALMESEYAQMKELYSENSPKLVLLRKQIEFFRGKIAEQQKETVSAVLKSAKKQEQMSQDEFEEAKKKALQNSSLNVQYAVLKKEAQTNEEIYKALLQKTKELQVATQVIGNNIVAVAQPSLPATAVKPRVALNLLIGCFLGLIAGVLAAVVHENLDKSVHDSRDLGEARLLNLGMVPNWDQLPKILTHRTQNHNNSNELVVWHESPSPLTEAFSLIKTSIFLTYSSEQYRVILLASAQSDEGKSSCSFGLASNLAKSGKRVLLVDADMRKYGLSRMLNASASRKGLATALSSKKENGYRDVIGETSFKNLYFIPAGPNPEDPAGLLESPKMGSLLESLRNEFDFILMDSPPVIGLPDPRILAALSDGIVFVVRQGHASLDTIESAVAALSGPKCGKILGTIFNHVEVSNSSRFGYGYATYSHYSRYRYNDYYGSHQTG